MPDAKGHSSNKVIDVEPKSVQDAWQDASDSESDLSFAGDELNPHFAYDDEDDHVRHQVWFLDAVTAMNEMRAARMMGIQTFALWALGTEDTSMWNIWDQPGTSDMPKTLEKVQPGNDVNTAGEGDILRITGVPQNGARTIDMDAHNQTATDEHMQAYPAAVHHRVLRLPSEQGRAQLRRRARSQMDAKDPRHPEGETRQGDLHDDRRAGAGQHGPAQTRCSEKATRSATTPTPIRTSARSPPRQVELELNLTERLFASKLGVQPLYFRPPYSIDQEPDTNDQAAPVVSHRADGLHHHRRQDRHRRLERASAQDAAGDHRQRFGAVGSMKTKPQFRGSHHPAA